MGTRRYEIRTVGVLLGAALLLVTGTASADIDGFEVLSIEAACTKARYIMALRVEALCTDAHCVEAAVGSEVC